jgi:Trk-type K+ transport system membrane component
VVNVHNRIAICKCGIRANSRWPNIISRCRFSSPSPRIHDRRRVPSPPQTYQIELFQLTLVRNTGFPCLLRLIIWILFKLSPKGSVRKETYKFLLDHPRRCFTLLFPSSENWWLVIVLVILNLMDLFFFLVLDIGNDYTDAIPVGYRILDGFFQAISTRTAGVGVVNLQLLNPAILVSYLVMMYISAYPVAISIRRTNVYEEQSLGIFAAEEEEKSSFLSMVLPASFMWDVDLSFGL